MLAKIIAIEGPDRCGKATQSRLLSRRLNLFGKAIRYEIPFNDHLTYKLIYWMLENGHAKNWTDVFQFVQFLNKFIFQFILLIQMFRYDYIVLDRWHMSSIVYGDASGADKRLTRLYSMFLLLPDMTIILCGEKHRRPEEIDDSYESDSKLQMDVKKAYDNFAVNPTRATGYSIPVRSEGTRFEVAERVFNVIDYLYGEI